MNISMYSHNQRASIQWNSWKFFISLFLFIIMILKIIYALNTPNKYTVETTLIPQNQGVSLGLTSLIGGSLDSNSSLGVVDSFGVFLADGTFMEEFITKNNLTDKLISPDTSTYRFAFDYRGVFDMLSSPSTTQSKQNEVDKLYIAQKKLKEMISISDEKRNGTIIVSVTNADRHLSKEILDLFVTAISSKLKELDLKLINKKLVYYKITLEETKDVQLISQLATQISSLTQEKIVLNSGSYYKFKMITEPSLPFYKDVVKPEPSTIVIASVGIFVALVLVIVFLGDYIVLVLRENVGTWRQKNDFILLLKQIMIFFSFALPKAGTKLMGIYPLYIANTLFTLFFPFLFIKIIKFINRPMNKIYIAIVMFMIISFTFNFIRSKGSTFELVDNILALFSVLLLGYFFMLKHFNIKINDTLKVIKLSVYILIIYSFLQKVFGEYSVVIPGITANYYEAIIPNFLSEKHNMIWGLNYLKLTSTYQNGNLFGINFIMLFWFAYFSAIESWKKKLLLLCYVIIGIMTASATVIIGIIFSLFLLSILSKNKLTISIILFRLLFVFLAISFIFYIYSTNNILWELLSTRLLDRDLSGGGGRIEPFIMYIKSLIETEDIISFLIGSMSINHAGGSYEMLIPTFFYKFGLIGTLLIILFFFFILKKIGFKIYAIGLYTYIFISFSDGAFWLPPTSINLSLLLGLALMMTNEHKRIYQCKN